MPLSQREIRIGGTSPGIGQWEVAERYVVRDGMIIPSGRLDHRRYYYPILINDLPLHLAEVEDEASALEFVHQWGMLGRSELYAHDVRGDMDRLLNYPYGDPLEWVYAHAETVRMLRNLVVFRDERKLDQIAAYLKEMKKTHRAIPYGAGHEIRFLPMPILDAIERHAMHVSADVIQNLLSPNTCYLELAAAANDVGELEYLFHFNALLPVIYGHVLDAAVGRIQYYQCQHRNCQRWNVLKKNGPGPKPRYCPPDVEGMESQCSRRERYYRNKKEAS
jgi:hypothetical protein